MALNKEFERYHTKIEIPASVVLETIFSTDNKDVETLSRWALKHGFVDLVEKENGKYYQLQDDYEKQSFYTYLSKKERKQYEYEDYLIEQLGKKENIINELEKWLNEEYDATIFDYHNAIEDVIDKLIELKGGNKE